MYYILKLVWIFTFSIAHLRGDDHNQRILSAQNNQIELDILLALNVSNEMRGVKELQIKETGDKAWRFHSAFDHVQIPPNITFEFLNQLNNQLSIDFTYRQHRKTVATLLSVNSPGKMSPWLRLVSDTKRNKLLFDYRVIEDNKLHEKKFHINKCKFSSVEKLHNWNRISLSINETRLMIRVGCCNDSILYEQELAGNIYLKLPLDSLIYFRQEPGFKKKLLGAVGEAKINNWAKEPSRKCFN